MAFEIQEIKPLFTAIITTARLYVGDQLAGGGLIVNASKLAGTMNPIQQVYAVGDMATGLKPGDVVKLNFKRYAKVKHTPGAIEDNVQSDNLNMYYEFPYVEIDGVKYLKLDKADVEYIITKYHVDEGGLFE